MPVVPWQGEQLPDGQPLQVLQVQDEPSHSRPDLPDASSGPLVLFPGDSDKTSEDVKDMDAKNQENQGNSPHVPLLAPFPSMPPEVSNSQ